MKENDYTALLQPVGTKQETLEEVAERYYEDEVSINAFINGAKWQQERSYSEEEVEFIANEMVNWTIDNIGNPNPQSGKKFDEIMSKFKKK